MLRCTPFLKKVTLAFPFLVPACPVHGQNEVALSDSVVVEQVASDMTPEVQTRWPHLAAINIPVADGTSIAGTNPQLVDFLDRKSVV